MQYIFITNEVNYGTSSANLLVLIFIISWNEVENVKWESDMCGV